jgi:hypothetical protein
MASRCTAVARVDVRAISASTVMAMSTKPTFFRAVSNGERWAASRRKPLAARILTGGWPTTYAFNSRSTTSSNAALWKGLARTASAPSFSAALKYIVPLKSVLPDMAMILAFGRERRIC